MEESNNNKTYFQFISLLIFIVIAISIAEDFIELYLAVEIDQQLLLLESILQTLKHGILVISIGLIQLRRDELQFNFDNVYNLLNFSAFFIVLMIVEDTWMANVININQGNETVNLPDVLFYVFVSSLYSKYLFFVVLIFVCIKRDST